MKPTTSILLAGAISICGIFLANHLDRAPVAHAQTFPVHPDPISGMQCWHQEVRVRKAESTDNYGDIHVDTEKSREVYQKWLRMTRPADKHSPDGTRRPYWMLRPLKPAREFYKLPEGK